VNFSLVYFYFNYSNHNNSINIAIELFLQKKYLLHKQPLVNSFPRCLKIEIVLVLVLVLVLASISSLTLK
jgi:hypothetical protein